MWRLFVPLKYLRLHHPEKWLFDWALPLVVTIAVWAPLMAFGNEVAVFGEHGLVNSLHSILAILTGFFIAALAAVATFNGPNMDERIAGNDSVRLRHRTTYQNLETGKKETIEEYEDLTRRRFLCFMFGFLAYSGFILLLVALFAEAFPAMFASAVPTGWLPVLKGAFLLVYGFAFFQLVIITFLGLFYLTDRIHRRDPKLVRGHPANGTP